MTDDDQFGSPNHHFVESCKILMWTTLIVAVLGIAANILIVVIRLRPKLRSPVNTLLIALAIADLGFLLFGTLAFVPQNCDKKPTSFLVVFRAVSDKYFYPPALMFQMASIYMLTIVTIERYIAVCHPLSVKLFCTYRNQAISIIMVMTVCFGFNFTRFFENDLKFDNRTGLIIGSTPIFTETFGEGYFRVYTGWLYAIVMFLIPLTVLVALNLIIIKTLKASRLFRQQSASCGNVARRGTGLTNTIGLHQEWSTTIMLLMITLIFILTSLLPVGLRIFTTVFHERSTAELQKLLFNDTLDEQKLSLEINSLIDSFPSDKVEVLTFVSNFLVFVNASLNFPIYFVFSTKFRNGFTQLFSSLTSVTKGNKPSSHERSVEHQVSKIENENPNGIEIPLLHMHNPSYVTFQ